MTQREPSIRGAITALVTPMRDGKVDTAALGRLVDDQIIAGIHGLVAVGTTGESATLSVREHVEVIRRVVEVAGKRVPVIAGAGANSTAEAIELSKASEAAGADALLHVTPYYNRPPQEGLYRHYAAIARETSLPIVLYNVPSRTACDLLPETVERLAEIETIVAIKEATDVRRAGELIAAVGDRIAVLAGDDVIALPVMALGGQGVISVVSNVMPGHMASLCDAMRAGDLVRAREIHFELLPLFQLLFAEPNPIPTKTALELMSQGRDLGGPSGQGGQGGRMSGEVRLPLAPCSPALRARLSEYLRTKGLL